MWAFPPSSRVSSPRSPFFRCCTSNTVLLPTPFDGTILITFLIASNPITIAVIALALRIARARQTEYLALTLPAAGDVRVGPGRAGRIDAPSDALLYFGGISAGHAVSPCNRIQPQPPRDGLAALLFGAMIIAPAGEEILFPGFVSRLVSIVTKPHSHFCGGGAGCPVRLDRHLADFHHRAVRRLDALAQRIDAAAFCCTRCSI